jgi:hypothetical protein
MSEAKRLVRVCPDTLYRDLQGEGILLQLETGQYFGLDDVAHRTWQLMVEHGDLDLVRQSLESEYDTDPGILAADLERFTVQLTEKKLVEIETVPAGH